MNKLKVILCFSAIAAVGQTKDPAFAYMLKEKLRHNVSEIAVSEIQEDKYYYLDCRELSEFQISHLPNAIYIGPKPSKRTFLELPIDKPWVFYCSVGLRSENVANLGRNFNPNTYNLVGGIFEWLNQGKPIMDAAERPTDKIHPYNRVWGVWLNRGTIAFE